MGWGGGGGGGRERERESTAAAVFLKLSYLVLKYILYNPKILHRSFIV